MASDTREESREEFQQRNLLIEKTDARLFADQLVYWELGVRYLIAAATR